MTRVATDMPNDDLDARSATLAYVACGEVAVYNVHAAEVSHPFCDINDHWVDLLQRQRREPFAGMLAKPGEKAAVLGIFDDHHHLVNRHIRAGDLRVKVYCVSTFNPKQSIGSCPKPKYCIQKGGWRPIQRSEERYCARQSPGSVPVPPSRLRNPSAAAALADCSPLFPTALSV